MKRLAGVAIAAIIVMSGVAAKAQTDLGGSFYRAFTNSTSGNGTVLVPKDSFGGLMELRHIHSRFIGFELSYGFNPADQTVSPQAGKCGYYCTNPTYAITATSSDLSINYVASMKPRKHLRPFAVAGLGFDITVPTSHQYYLNTIVRPAYLFGAGVDWEKSDHFGLRFQFRDNIFKAPDIAGIYPPTGGFQYLVEPLAGAYYRF